MPSSKVLIRTLAATALAVGLPVALCAPAASAASTAGKSQVSVSYTAVGTSHIKSIDADLPIAKTSLVSKLNTKNLQIVGGRLAIAPQTVSFTALGAIPIRATTTLTQTSRITGTLTPGKKGTVLATAVHYSIQLSDVEAQILGQWVPLQVGDNCRTVKNVKIAVKSPAGHYFDIFKGGLAEGTYTIGQFANCAPLGIPDPTGLGSLTVNALVPGSGNTVSLTLSHGHSVSG